eukprot:TRINITY_DN1080_c1_g1_i2.p1 TRINITY_DN1080_c1_g1~~TRINITY_DN1080_c1_g1_i2.p1  ORF type:complete len:358 (+),score=86.22 TRINITY_DN1080_c1_g1_i2:1130-2203(+)
MPISLSRRHVPMIQSKPYYVSEKTDGVRYMMLICSLGVYLVDRKFSFYKVNFPQLTTVFSVDDKLTLLDGELIRNVTTNKINYLLFDVVMVNGEHCGNEKFSKRMNIIGEHVIRPYRDMESTSNPSEFPYIILAKRFHDKKKFTYLLTCIKSEPDKTRYYRDDKRHHKMDGFIFTPDEPYALKTTHTLFKWKYSDKQTIDFRARRNSETGVYTLSIQVHGGESDCFQVNFRGSDQARLAADWEKHKIKDDAIVECLYDKWSGEWRYYGLRPDKKAPNFIRIAMETMMSLSEDVTKEELAYRLQFDDPKHDDFVMKEIERRNKALAEAHYSSTHHQHHHHQQQSQHHHQQQQQQQHQT